MEQNAIYIYIFFLFLKGIFAHFGPCSLVAFFFYREKGKKKKLLLTEYMFVGIDI